MKIEQLPEDQAYVEAYDRALRKHGKTMLEEAAALMERYAARGITTIKGAGFPLRPLFLPRRLLEEIGRSLIEGFERLRIALLDHLEDSAWLAEHLPIPPALFQHLNFRESLSKEAFFSVLRPDGFLFSDRYALIEPNFGNGSLISNAYTEILFDYFQGSTVFREIGWPSTGLDRPFQRLIEMLRSRLPAGKQRYFVALFCHHWEHQVIQTWEERVIQQLYLAQQILAEQGIDTRVVYEDGFSIDESGHTHLKEDGQRVDLVLQFTIGTSFMDEPWLFEDALAHLTSAKIGDAPLIKPLASLCIDKGTLPLMNTLGGWPICAEENFRVEIPWTTYPSSEGAAEYRLNKDQYVLKRAFDGKDTHVGISTAGRLWNRVLAQALESKAYVLQRYQPMPQTIMPMCFDGEHIEWVPVRVELSPFLVEGRYAGAIARYAPEAEGLVMSPPPENMGLTNVFGT